MPATEDPGKGVRVALHRLQSTVELIDMSVSAGYWDVAEEAAIQAGHLLSNLLEAVRRLADAHTRRSQASNG